MYVVHYDRCENFPWILGFPWTLWFISVKDVNSRRDENFNGGGGRSLYSLACAKRTVGLTPRPLSRTSDFFLTPVLIPVTDDDQLLAELEEGLSGDPVEQPIPVNMRGGMLSTELDAVNALLCLGSLQLSPNTEE